MKEVELLGRELDKVVNRNTDPVDSWRDYLLTKITTFRNLANFYNALENDVTAIGFIEEIKNRYEQDEIRMIKRILIEGVRNEFEIYDFNLAAIGITMAIKGLEMPLSAGTYGNMNLERSVDVILRDPLLRDHETLSGVGPVNRCRSPFSSPFLPGSHLQAPGFRCGL